MRDATDPAISASTYDREKCMVGVVHLGFGAFHKAHQAVYLDTLMEQTGDLRWGIAAVNLREAEARQFATSAKDITRNDGYYLKSVSHVGAAEVHHIRPHIAFADWSVDAAGAEALLAVESVHLVTITVTESGYCTDANGALDLLDPVIAEELQGGSRRSVYAYLRAGLKARIQAGGAKLTIACCDNIRQNGKMLTENFSAYLRAFDDQSLLDWVRGHVSFPSSMVDRITPRTVDALALELSKRTGTEIATAVMAEDFIQWVLEDDFKGALPGLGAAGVTITPDVDPYEETKIRVLNGGHTALTYMAALEGLTTFDQAMSHPDLRAHFDAFETQEVLPAITLDLPFGKSDYLAKIRQRFSNSAIGDTVARICADGVAKFPIFIRPTLEGCFEQGILPRHTIASIASWHQFARHVVAGKIPFQYMEPSWDQLRDMLGKDTFIMSRALWGDVPETYPEFAVELRQAIKEAELKWPV